jgi:hypothetical protein
MFDPSLCIRPAWALSLLAGLFVGCGSATTYDGTWINEGTHDGLHVSEVNFQSASFPCDGDVKFQYGQGQVFVMDVKWMAEGKEIVGMFGDADPREQIATVKLDASKLVGHFTCPISIGDSAKESDAVLIKKPPSP